MGRKFIYTSDWTVPIDQIKRISYDDRKVIIKTEEAELYILTAHRREVYQDIQRQLMEAE